MKEQKRIVLSAGGTGGHLFPAQSLAESLPEWEVLFIAGGLRSSRYFDREKFSFEEIASATFSLSKPMQALGGCSTIIQGVYQARKKLRKFRPRVVVGFGSFYTLPLLLAAALERIPIVLHEQNAILGKVNRLFAPFVHTTTITFPITRSHIKGRSRERAIEVIFPLRKRDEKSTEEIRKYFGLECSRKPILLIFGGSQGAAKLNSLFLESLSYLPPLQVIHFTGNEERAQAAKREYQILGIPAYVKAFEPRIDLAMRIADFALTRAGAATIAELIAYDLPALLIPYPFASQNHQEKNGEHFVSTVKGGEMYKEQELNASLLATLIMTQLEHIEETKKNIVSYKQTRCAPHLARVIEENFI